MAWTEVSALRFVCRLLRVACTRLDQPCTARSSAKPVRFWAADGCASPGIPRSLAKRRVRVRVPLQCPAPQPPSVVARVVDYRIRHLSAVMIVYRGQTDRHAHARKYWHDCRMTRVRLPVGVCAVVFDVGETLVDESRAWSAQAERAGVTPFTLMGVLGALIARDEDHRHVWDLLGVERPTEPPLIERADLYPDALACLRAAQQAGLSIGIAGNQPAGVETQLRDAGLDVDFIASSAAWGVTKPSSEFFSRVITAAQCDAEQILYVGDRLDNDVLPARRAGMRTAFIRRGPWGYLHAQRPDVALADLQIESLIELTTAFTRPETLPL